MEEHFDIQMYAKAKLDFNQPNHVWLLYQGEYVPFRKERTCCIFPKPSDSDFVSDWHYLCSECGREIPVYERNPHDYKEIICHANYCPHCGARVVQ